MQIVFQDPYSAINPRMQVGESIGEPLLVHGIAKGPALDRRVRELLDLVGMPASAAARYPHQFSGGQRQRIGDRPRPGAATQADRLRRAGLGARRLGAIADPEPAGALQRELGVAYLFISHDLSVVRHISDRVGVMYLGKLVEVASTDALFAAPQHPYTLALMSAIPAPGPAAAARPRTGSCSRASCPRRRHRPAAAAFTPAALTYSSAAPPNSRC